MGIKLAVEQLGPFSGRSPFTQVSASEISTHEDAVEQLAPLALSVLAQASAAAVGISPGFGGDPQVLLVGAELRSLADVDKAKFDAVSDLARSLAAPVLFSLV